MPRRELEPAPFRNEGLFTDHYLLDVLPATSELWSLEGLEAARAEILALWGEQAGKVADYSESQLEKHFVQPVLDLLGHAYEVQPRAGQHRPDYGFFADDASRDSALPADGREGYWAAAVAVGDAKSWECKLDKKLSGGSGWGFGNPSFQIYYYLAETRRRWAILTNGRHWRLYSGDPKPDMEVFYEVDLPELLEADSLDAFAYFRLFLGREAFVPGPDGRSFLDRVRAESDLAAERLREDVQERVYRALLEACRGFMSHAPNTLTDDHLQAVYDGALVFLYRLLFVLYGESAGLLPVRDSRRYRERYSLHAAKQDVAEGGVDVYVDRLATLWPRLGALWTLIDKGHPAMGIPAYNGGLFDPSKHPFLERHAMADHEVARVIDLVAQTPAGDFVDYRDLGVRHLGSIYEGLLEYRLARAVEPMVVVRDGGKERWVSASATAKPGAERCDAGDLYLVTDKGERKATGSYYTPQFIVEYIVGNTLGPLVERCQTADEVLSLKVLDPAMGSGHFLVEATGFLARKALERQQAHDAETAGTAIAPTDEGDLADMKRLVVERCIYGVDLNPLAVELAKLSLWLHTVAQGLPLSFLDHHLRCGNSLIGARVEDLPTLPEASAKQSKRAAKEAAAGQLTLFNYSEFARHTNRLVFGFGEITRMLSDTREAVQHKDEILRQIEDADRRPYREIGDLWCSRFFGNEYGAAVYNELVQWLQDNGNGLSETAEAVVARSRDLAQQYRFLHWELEFPEVFFDAQGRRMATGGFDAVVGNPPWERIKLQENEFFALRDAEIALAPTAAKRKALIAKLPSKNPALWDAYQRAKQRADLELAWARDSGRYPLMGRGDTNLYALMTERGRALLMPGGREGLVVPSGIATDTTTSAFFADIVGKRSLQTLFDFENRERPFADVDSRFKFTIIILTGGEEREAFDYGCFLRNENDIVDPERVFTLHPDDCALMNPNTRTCPIFRTRRDADLTRAIYKRVPVLVRKTDDGEENPWGIRYATMFHMTNDSGLFRTAAELEADGFYPVAGNAWKKAGDLYLPLYVGKMVRPYDHRAASVDYHPENTFNPYVARDTSAAQKQGPGFSPQPRFWVPEEEVGRRGGDREWTLVFRDIARATDERTMIAAIGPRAGYGNKLPLLVRSSAGEGSACLLANLAGFPFDYVVRQKLGSTSLNWFIVQQLPVLPPSRYDDDFGGVRLSEFVGERVLELTYTAHDIAGFAEDMGYVDEEGNVRPPFPWDEERRLHLRCQLDALYFHLYGLTREEAEYVMDTFPIVRRHDMAQFGRFRTKELIVHYYSAYAAGDMGAWVSG